MKKATLTIVTLLFLSFSYGQSIGLGAGKTVDAYLGFTAGELRIEYNFILPYNKTEKSTANAFTLGYGIVLTNKDADSYDNISQFVVTPLIGVSMYKYKTFSETKDEVISNTSLMYGVETSIRQHAGEFFLYGKKYAAKESTFGIGFRCFINKLQ